MYPELFKQQTPFPSAAPADEKDKPFVPWTEGKDAPPSPIDQALSERVSRDILLRIKVMSMVLQFLGNRPARTEDVEKLYDMFYKKIKNGR